MVNLEILHLWRASSRFNVSNKFIMQDQARLIRSEQEMFARSDGNAENFHVRLHDNNSTTIFNITFQVNGIVKATIEIPIGVFGIFFPDFLGAIPFLKDDLLVMEIVGYTDAAVTGIEHSVDLKFFPLTP